MPRPSPRESERAKERGLLQELEDVYRDVDAAYAAYSCPGTTECCHFGVTGREPYVTSIELAAIRRAVAAREGPLPVKKRVLPILRSPGHPDERSCPLLSADGGCSIYAARPLGCRSFWCHRADISANKVTRQQLASFVRRIQAIAVRHDPAGDQGRPLGRLLFA